MADSDSQSKEFEPSQRKLDESRHKGDIPRSTDVTGAAAIGGLLAAFLLSGGGTVHSLGEALTAMLRDSALAREIGSDSSLLAGRWIATTALPVLPVFLIPGLAVLAALIATRSMTVSGEKLAPKGERIDPIKNAKQKFGFNGLFEFGKSFAKLLLIGTVLAAFLNSRLEELVSTSLLAPGRGMTVMWEMLAGFLLLTVILSAVIGILDLLWQRLRHHAKMRMSRQELKEESRQNEGDPHLKQQRRQRGYQISNNRMLQEVSKADVIIVNPTHYAVALKWDRNSGRAPICVAKGMDELAQRIRRAAAKAGIPIHADPPTARALYATVEPGDEIRPEQYRTVAAAIRFSEKMRRRSKVNL